LLQDFIYLRLQWKYDNQLHIPAPTWQLYHTKKSY
jgi:hypothetical protein